MSSVRELLDPELRAVFATFELPPLDGPGLAALRAGGLGAPQEPSGKVAVTERTVPADPPVTVRIHRAVDASGPLPAVVALHGGGFVIGSAAMYDPAFDRWCPALGVVGVAVEYRLAPETPYPGPLEDCYAALRWTHDHADELAVDPARIGVAGISAGGGLAAGLALLARDRGEVPLAFQLLDCPMLDDRPTPSNRVEDLYVWNRDANDFGWRSYLGERFGTDDVPGYAAPARAPDLTGLPAAFVSVGAIDGFRDEDVQYALRLNQSGVPCELHVYPGLPHAYQLAQRAAMVRKAARDIDDWLARQVGSGS